MNDMKHFSDNIFGFSVCRPFPPSEGVRKTQENARLRKVGKAWWTEKCSARQFSWRCCICPPSEGVRKTQENARLRKVGKAWWTEKCSARQFSWQCCICPPLEGVRKTQENARLRKVGKVRWTGKCGDRRLSWQLPTFGRCAENAGNCSPSEGGTEGGKEKVEAGTGACSYSHSRCTFALYRVFSSRGCVCSGFGKIWYAAVRGDKRCGCGGR